jgi:kinesin family protein 5
MPAVEDVLNGFNGTIMAYGQTGSGKTHTIFGSRSSLDHLYSKRGAEEVHFESGIVPRCVNHIFYYIKDNPNKAQFRITVSFLEIYMEQITDLLQQ